jgi:hypothetical protein
VKERSPEEQAAFHAKMRIVDKTYAYLSATAALKALLEELQHALYYPERERPSPRLVEQIQRHVSTLAELRGIDGELAEAYGLYGPAHAIEQSEGAQ